MLTPKQAQDIVEKWNGMHPDDQKPISFPRRTKDELKLGWFKKRSSKSCCVRSIISRLLQRSWPNLQVRLDIWHFMRRVASCVTTDSHPLYGTFMRQLSSAIFVWDATDMKRLEEAKGPLSSLKIRLIARHCKRTTRGEDETTRLLHKYVAYKYMTFFFGNSHLMK